MLKLFVYKEMLRIPKSCQTETDFSVCRQDSVLMRLAWKSFKQSSLEHFQRNDFKLHAQFDTTCFAGNYSSRSRSHSDTRLGQMQTSRLQIMTTEQSSSLKDTLWHETGLQGNSRRFSVEVESSSLVHGTLARMKRRLVAPAIREEKADGHQ